VILEAFKPGTAPTDAYAANASGEPGQGQEGAPGFSNPFNSGYVPPSPDADRAVRRGNGIY
jgi:hypothetical protein